MRAVRAFPNKKNFNFLLVTEPFSLFGCDFRQNNRRKM